MISEALRKALEHALGNRIETVSHIGGGDINEACRVQLTDGNHYFIKYHRNAPDGMFEKEAKGLAWLAETETIRIPNVVAHGNAEGGLSFLALEWIAQNKPSPKHDEAFGHGLARLHSSAPPHYGLAYGNYIGSLAQSNHPRDTWAEFYWHERLMPMIERAQRHDLMPTALRKKFDILHDCLPQLSGPEKGPARLHGDLWSGNALCDEHGLPCLIDPAVYGGHAEMDLAMMKLFGGFSSRVFAAYQEVTSLEPGFEERIPLHQLYPLLVHVNLFGSGYIGSLSRHLQSLGI